MKKISMNEFWRYLREGVIPSETVCTLDTYDLSGSIEGTWRTIDTSGKLGYIK